MGKCPRSPSSKIVLLLHSVDLLMFPFLIASCDAEVPLDDTDLVTVPEGDWFCAECCKNKKTKQQVTAAASTRGSKRTASAAATVEPPPAVIELKRSTRSAK